MCNPPTGCTHTGHGRVHTVRSCKHGGSTTGAQWSLARMRAGTRVFTHVLSPIQVCTHTRVRSHIHVFAHIRTCVLSDIHIYTHTPVLTLTFLYTHGARAHACITQSSAGTHVHTRTPHPNTPCSRVCTRTYLHMYTCTHTYTHVHTHTCTYLHTHTCTRQLTRGQSHTHVHRQDDTPVTTELPPDPTHGVGRYLKEGGGHGPPRHPLAGGQVPHHRAGRRCRALWGEESSAPGGAVCTDPPTAPGPPCSHVPKQP